MMKGFTLIELVVAIALMATVSVLAYRGLDGMMKARARTEAEAARWQEIALFIDRFRFDVQQPAARPVRRGSRGEPAWLAVTARDGSDSTDLSFTRRPLAGQDERRLGYRLREGRIELLAWPALDSGDGTSALPTSFPLLEGVRSFKLRFLAAGNQWLDQWAVAPDSAELPRAVSLRLVMADGVDLTRIFVLP